MKHIEVVTTEVIKVNKAELEESYEETLARKVLEELSVGVNGNDLCKTLEHSYINSKLT